MFAVTRSIGALVLGMGLVVVANGLLGTVVSLRMGIEAFSPAWIGLILSAYYAGLTAGALLVGRLIHRVGHIRVFAAAAAATCAVTLGLGTLPFPPAWLALRLLAGFCMAAIYMAIESWLNARAASNTRGEVLAAYMSINQAALAAGQLLVPGLPPATMSAFVVAAVLYSVALVPVALTYVPQPEIPSPTPLAFRRLLASAPLGVVGCLVAGVATGVIVTLGPLHVAALGRGLGETARFMAVVVLGGLALQWPLGRLSDLIGRRPVLIGVCATLAAVTLLLGAYEAPPTLVLLGLGGATGALVFVIYPLALAYANDVIATEDMVAASGWLILVFGVGAAVGPLVGTAAISALGPGGPFYWIAAVCGALSLFSIYRVLTGPTITDPAPYIAIPMPQSAPGSQLDPRTDTQLVLALDEDPDAPG